MCGKSFTFGRGKKSQNHNWKKSLRQIWSLFASLEANLLGACIQPTTTTIWSSSTHNCFSATDCTQKWHKVWSSQNCLKIATFPLRNCSVKLQEKLQCLEANIQLNFQLCNSSSQAGCVQVTLSNSENFILCFQHIYALSKCYIFLFSCLNPFTPSIMITDWSSLYLLPRSNAIKRKNLSSVLPLINAQLFIYRQVLNFIKHFSSPHLENKCYLHCGYNTVYGKRKATSQSLQVTSIGA